MFLSAISKSKFVTERISVVGVGAVGAAAGELEVVMLDIRCPSRMSRAKSRAASVCAAWHKESKSLPENLATVKRKQDVDESIPQRREGNHKRTKGRRKNCSQEDMMMLDVVMYDMTLVRRFCCCMWSTNSGLYPRHGCSDEACRFSTC